MIDGCLNCLASSPRLCTFEILLCIRLEMCFPTVVAAALALAGQVFGIS